MWAVCSSMWLYWSSHRIIESRQHLTQLAVCWVFLNFPSCHWYSFWSPNTSCEISCTWKCVVWNCVLPLLDLSFSFVSFLSCLVIVHMTTSACPWTPILRLTFLNLSVCYFYLILLRSLCSQTGCLHEDTPNQLSFLFFYFFPLSFPFYSNQAALQVRRLSLSFPPL